MVSSFTPNVMMHALEHALERWDVQRKEGQGEGHPAMTIAISREAGAQGAEVAKTLGEMLGWPVYDNELLRLIGEEMGVRTRLLESVDEKHVSWLQECLEAFCSDPSINQSAYVRRLVETLLSLSTRGEAVIVGRGAVHILPTETTLRVRLIADLPDRITTLQRKFNLNREDAARRADQMDRERRKFVLEHFHKNPEDTHQYDLLLNTSRFTVAECAGIIIDALRKMQAKARVQAPVRSKE